MEYALDVFAQGESGWAGDLASALEPLPHPVTLRTADKIHTEGDVDALISRVERSLHDQLLEDIATSPKLYLMVDRLELQRRGPPKKTVMQFRHYLHLNDKDERKAFIRILASEHPFALEKFRHAYSRNYKKYAKVPRERRMCRMCAVAVESPGHALLLCDGKKSSQRVGLNCLR